jgi:hypothetical protein
MPVLLLQRGGGDAARLRRHLRTSSCVEPAVVGPDALLCSPLRWPADPRVHPVAMLALLPERAGALASAEQLARRLGEVPLVVVADGSRDFALALLEVGAEDVLEAAHLSGPALEQTLGDAVARRVGRILDVADVERPVDLPLLTDRDPARRAAERLGRDRDAGRALHPSS